jgi:hypothetical protein
MHVTNLQIRKVTMEYQKSGKIEAAALKEGMTRKTASKYIHEELPLEPKGGRNWRTQENPFEAHWPEVKEHLKVASELEGQALFEWHCGLSYSNWEWTTICQRESFLALRQGLQAVLLRLGHVPREHWTDHSTVETHEVAAEEKKGRGFNRSCLDLMSHFGIEPHTIQVKKPRENRDTEF